LEQQVPNRHVILGFLDVILTVPAFFIEFNHFFWRLFRVGDKKEIIVVFAFQERYSSFAFLTNQ